MEQRFRSLEDLRILVKRIRNLYRVDLERPLCERIKKTDESDKEKWTKVWRTKERIRVFTRKRFSSDIQNKRNIWDRLEWVSVSFQSFGYSSITVRIRHKDWYPTYKGNSSIWEFHLNLSFTSVFESFVSGTTLKA